MSFAFSQLLYRSVHSKIKLIFPLFAFAYVNYRNLIHCKTKRKMRMPCVAIRRSAAGRLNGRMRAVFMELTDAAPQRHGRSARPDHSSTRYHWRWGRCVFPHALKSMCLLAVLFKMMTRHGCCLSTHHCRLLSRAFSEMRRCEWFRTERRERWRVCNRRASAFPEGRKPLSVQ